MRLWRVRSGSIGSSRWDGLRGGDDSLDVLNDVAGYDIAGIRQPGGETTPDEPYR